MKSVIHRPDGSVLDHVGWGVPDTKTGIETLTDLTGDDSIQRPTPDPSLYFSNGILRLDTGMRFVEVIGPNPEYEGEHPFGEFLAGLSQPRLLFWYVAVERIEAFAEEIEQVDHELASVEHVVPERDEKPEYKRGIIESRFPLTMPNVIEWADQEDRSISPEEAEQRCSVQEFQIKHPEAKPLQACFTDLGIEQPVVGGQEPALELTLETPQGSVTLSGQGHPW
jgi:hypothetical protein